MIAMKVVPAEPGMKGFDCLAPVNDDILKAAWDDGCRFVVRYVHSITAAEIECILRNGFGFMLVTYANNWNPSDAVSTVKALCYPAGATLWLDVESVSLGVPDEILRINTWATTVRNGGYDPGEYAGCQQLLTWQQLTRLAVDRYWESCSLVVDANGNPSRPATNWNMTQIYPPNIHKYGTVVDLDFIRADSRGRVPMMAVAA